MGTEGTEDWTPAWLALIRTHARLWDQVQAQMRHDSGLTVPRYDVLMQLDMAGGRLGLSELASTIVLSPSGLSKLLDRMDASGLLRREPDPRDARSTFARITPKGRSLVRKARQTHHAWLQRAFGDALDDRDLADLARIMGRIDAHTPSRGGHPEVAAISEAAADDIITKVQRSRAPLQQLKRQPDH